MKHLFISRERILLQRYKHDRVFRVAGSLLLAATFLQLPLGVFGFFLWNRVQAESYGPITNWDSNSRFAKPEREASRSTSKARANPTMRANFTESYPYQCHSFGHPKRNPFGCGTRLNTCWDWQLSGHLNCRGYLSCTPGLYAAFASNCQVR